MIKPVERDREKEKRQILNTLQYFPIINFLLLLGHLQNYTGSLLVLVFCISNEEVNRMENPG